MTSNAKQVNLTIDGRELTVDASLTILEAARQNAIPIPTLCHHPALSDWGGCRLCVVQVDHSPKLVASCVMPVRNGMEVVTHNEAIHANRRMTLELLFAERNHNCMFCPRSGACELQQSAYDLQMDHLTVAPAFDPYPVDMTGEFMTIDHSRCILCGRCVRACRELAGAYVLGFHYRGPRTLVGFDLLATRDASACLNCGVCLQVCPTGAISNRYRAHYAVKGQPIDSPAIASVCAGCGLLCPTRTISRDNQLVRVEGILGVQCGRPDRGQLCVKGRFEVLKTDGQRLLQPMIKDADGEWRAHSWETAYAAVRNGFDRVADRQGAGALFGLVSGSLSNETLVLFRDLMAEFGACGDTDTFDGGVFRALVRAVKGTGRSLPLEFAWQRMESADFILVAGADALLDHPLLPTLLRRAFIERKVPVAMLGCNSCGAPATDLSLGVESNALPGLVCSLARMCGAESRTTAEVTLASDQTATLENIAASFTGSKSPWVVLGAPVVLAPHPDALAALMALARLKGDPARDQMPLTVLKPAANSAAAWRLGLAGPDPLQDRARVGLMLVGSDIAKAIETPLKYEFLVAVTPHLSARLVDTTHVLLPGTSWMEEDGTYAGLDGYAAVFKPRVLPPPPDARPTWKIIQEIGLACGRMAVPAAWDEVRRNARMAFASSTDRAVTYP